MKKLPARRKPRVTGRKVQSETLQAAINGVKMANRYRKGEAAAVRRVRKDMQKTQRDIAARSGKLRRMSMPATPQQDRKLAELHQRLNAQRREHQQFTKERDYWDDRAIAGREKVKRMRERGLR